MVAALDPRPGQGDASARALMEMNEYMAGLIERFRQEPGTGMLSGLAADEGMATDDVVATARLLLIAGHETTVNQIANGMLTLLRHPHVLDRLRGDRDLAVPLVEELLRYEPPVQLVPGIHYCFGAALARQEVQVALSELARRLENPRLVEDPPPYRQNPTLRGPRHLPIEIDGVKQVA